MIDKSLKQKEQQEGYLRDKLLWWFEHRKKEEKKKDGLLSTMVKAVKGN